MCCILRIEIPALLTYYYTSSQSVLFSNNKNLQKTKRCLGSEVFFVFFTYIDRAVKNLAAITV